MNSFTQVRHAIIFLLIGIISILLLAKSAVCGADMTSTITYQGLLTDPSGQPVPNDNYQLTFRIFNDSLTGTELWSEVHAAIHASGGLISVTLAGTDPIPLEVLSAQDATGQPLPLFLEVQVGSDPPLTPRSRLGGVLYAGQAARIRGDISTAPATVYLIDTVTNDTGFTMKVGHDAMMATIQNMRANSGSGDTSDVTIIADATGVRISGKRTDKFSVDSFFDITASDGGGGVSVGAAKPTSDTAVITINADTLRVRISGKKKISSGDADSFFDITASDNGGGIDIFSAKKVVKFRAGVSLANTVKRINPRDTIKEGSYITLTGDLDRFVDITVDSNSSSLVFADTLLDTTLLLHTGANGGSGEITMKRHRPAKKKGHARLTPDTLIYLDTTNLHNMGMLVVDSNGVSLTLSRSGSGVATSQVTIGDADGDGDLDLVAGDGSKCAIGTTNPTNILTVQQGSLTDPIADAWTTYSSRRWKKNIQPIQGALDKIKELRGVEYDWKANEKHDIGLIAEEVGKVIPEIVAYEPNGTDAKSVDYARLVALLIEGIKAQQNQIGVQNSTIDQLKVELIQIKSTLARLTGELELGTGEQHAIK